MAKFILIIISLYFSAQLIVAAPNEPPQPLQNISENYRWLGNQQLTNHAYDALDFIAASSRHGLDPEHYHYSTLTQIDPSVSPDTAQQFDDLLTEGLVQLIHDVRLGRLDPTDVDPQWFIPQDKFDAIEFLQQALLFDHLRSQLNALLPNTTDYYQLSNAASRYQRYVDRGGWHEIAELPLLHLGDHHPLVPDIRTRLAFEGYNSALLSNADPTRYDAGLEQAVRHFQHNHGLKVDGIIGTGTRQAMNVSANDRLQQIHINQERHRWLPRDLGQRYILINLANYQLRAIDNGEQQLAMRVVVGRKSRPTPSFASEMTNLVFNPYWNVPSKLARLDLLPKQQEDPNYFYLHNIRVFTIEQGQKIEHDPYTIDWSSLSSRNFPYTLRQDPGEHNALGQLKFMFPNSWQIYLHDTSHKDLFSEVKRDFSSGCIRVEDPIALANFSLAETDAEQTIFKLLDSQENSGRKLVKPLAIYAVYFTVWFDDNELIFSPDVYHRDQFVAEWLSLRLKNIYTR